MLGSVVVDVRPTGGVVSSGGQRSCRVGVHRDADDVRVGCTAGGAIRVDDRQVRVQGLVLDRIRRGEGDQVVAARGAANVRRHGKVRLQADARVGHDARGSVLRVWLVVHLDVLRVLYGLLFFTVQNGKNEKKWQLEDDPFRYMCVLISNTIERLCCIIK